MLQDTFLNTFWVCGIIVVVAVTLVILKWAFRVLFRRNKPAPVTRGSMRAMGEEPVPVFAVPEPVPESIIEVAEASVVPPDPPPEPIECGRCHKEIRSGYVEIKKKPPEDLMIFICEHCGAKVAIPV